MKVDAWQVMQQPYHMGSQSKGQVTFSWPRTITQASVVLQCGAEQDEVQLTATLGHIFNCYTCFRSRHQADKLFFFFFYIKSEAERVCESPMPEKPDASTSDFFFLSCLFGIKHHRAAGLLKHERAECSSIAASYMI